MQVDFSYILRGLSTEISLQIKHLSPSHPDKNLSILSISGPWEYSTLSPASANEPDSLGQDLQDQGVQLVKDCLQTLG
jgi:hypothetical protein